MTDPTNLTIITGIFVFNISAESQKKPQRHNYAPLLLTIGLTMWKANWWHGSGRRNSQFLLSVLTCFVCLLVVDNTSDSQPAIIPLHQDVELQKGILFLFWLWWMYRVTSCSHCKSIYTQRKSTDCSRVIPDLPWHSSWDLWLYRLLLIFGLGGKFVFILYYQKQQNVYQKIMQSTTLSSTL